MAFGQPQEKIVSTYLSKMLWECDTLVMPTRFIKPEGDRQLRSRKMSEDDFKDKKGKKSDYAEVEFEIGNIGFEAKGRSVVVERMFRLLLERIEHGKLVREFKLVEPDEDEEEEEEEPLPPEIMEQYETSEDEEETLEPPPDWDNLDSEEPDVSDAEKEELGF
jgi:hypothetical protein